MLDLKNTNFLTSSQIAQRASSVFTSDSASGVSKHYTHIPTSRVIEDMESLGWGVVDVKQVKCRSKNEGFQKHLVVFRNPNISIVGADGDDVFPQVLLTNSHDGKNAFNFIPGLFRMICENGLIVCERQFESLKIRHMGYNFEELQKGIHKLIETLPLVVNSMNEMKDVVLEENQTLEFAKKAIEARFGEEQVSRMKIDYKDLLTPARPQDIGNDLWSVFNVVQEKLLNGNFDYSTGTRVRKARQVKNFIQDKKINQDLYELALQYINHEVLELEEVEF